MRCTLSFPPLPHHPLLALPSSLLPRSALKTKHETPKYGLIYHASLIGQAPPKLKGERQGLGVLAAQHELSLAIWLASGASCVFAGFEGSSQPPCRACSFAPPPLHACPPSRCPTHHLLTFPRTAPLPRRPAGKISRVLAAKCALGVRVDALGEVSDEGAVGLEARAKVRLGMLCLKNHNPFIIGQLHLCSCTVVVARATFMHLLCTPAHAMPCHAACTPHIKRPFVGRTGRLAAGRCQF